MMLLPLSIFGAAVFAEPTITQIKKVVRLIHGLGLPNDKQTFDFAV